MINDMQATLATLDSRHDMDSDDLTKYLYENFSGSLLSLKQLQPLIAEVLRRFKMLSRTPSVTGVYPSIAGHFSFGAGKKDKVGWCQATLHRNARTVRYMLAGGNTAKATPKKESLSLPQVDEVLTYLFERSSEMSHEQRRMLRDGLSLFLGTLTKRVEKCQRKQRSKRQSV